MDTENEAKSESTSHTLHRPCQSGGVDSGGLLEVERYIDCRLQQEGTSGPAHPIPSFLLMRKQSPSEVK